jgi:hypothetical protein
MRRIVRRRWKSKFACFIQAYGVESLALELDVRPSAIYHWIRAATTPRPAHAEIIQRLARERGSRLTLEEIYGHSRAVRADEIKLETGIPPRPAARLSPLPPPVTGNGTLPVTSVTKLFFDGLRFAYSFFRLRLVTLISHRLRGLTINSFCEAS